MPALAEGFAAPALAHLGMPGADREPGEYDGQQGDKDTCPADERLVGGEAREEDGDPGGQEGGSGGQDEPAIAVLGEPAEYEHEHTSSVIPG